MDLFDRTEEEETPKEEESENKKESEAKPLTPDGDIDNSKWDRRLFVIDGYSVIYRSYFAHISKPILDKEGNNVSAYYGFFQTLFSLITNYKMDYLIVALDRKEPTFRSLLYPQYKANRDKAPEDLHIQVPEIVKTLNKMHIGVASRAGYEADDVIASLTERAYSEKIESVMVTGDKDLCQLVKEHVYVLRPPKKGDMKYRILKREEVKSEYGVYPEQMVDYLSLVGDQADNIPGVKGIGEKGAVKLLEEYLSFDGIYRHLDSISKGMRSKLEAGKEEGELSKRLIELSFDALDDSFDLRDYDTSKIERVPAGKDFEERGFRTLSKRAYGLEGKGDEDEEETEESAPSVLSDKEKSAFLGDGEYSLIDNIDEVRKRFRDIADFGSSEIALDILTDGYEDDSEILGFSFSWAVKKACFVPFFGEKHVSKSDAASLFDEYLATGRIKGIFHGAKYDLKALWSLCTDYESVSFDTMIASWMVDSNQNTYSIESDALKYFSVNLMNLKDFLSKDQKVGELDAKLLMRYSAERADYTYRLSKVLERRLYERGLFDAYSSIELPLIPILARMEREGIYLSEEKMESLKEATDSKVNELKKSIFDSVGHEFNLNSPQQLGSVLFDERKLPSGKKTQKGYSTDISTLEALRGTGDPIIELILEYRLLSKLKTTYIDVLPTLRDQSGRIHTTFLQTGTATGRLSSRNPNLQNIPIRTDEGRLIRSAFVPKEGCRFLSADYSQIELVVLAYMSSDKGLSEAFNMGEDVHRYTASKIFNKDVSDIDSHERRIAKTINFGIMYGMSAFRLSNELGITRSEAADFISRYFERYSGVKDFVESTIKSAEENGYVKTEYGHIREIIGINSRNKTEKAAAERVAVNTVIQGTAAEIMKKAMIKLSSEIDSRGLKSRLLLQVHDELIFEVPKGEESEMESLVKDTMENIVKLSVPLRASLQFGSSWGDIH